jgi:hypothetical protein
MRELILKMSILNQIPKAAFFSSKAYPGGAIAQIYRPA